MYKRQIEDIAVEAGRLIVERRARGAAWFLKADGSPVTEACLLYTSDAADERSRVDLGGRRFLQKKTTQTKKKRRKSYDVLRPHNIDSLQTPN